MSNEPILGFFDEYRFLSNFYPSPFKAGGLEYQWNEQWFMVHKSLDPSERQLVMDARTPGECKRIGKIITLRRDWEEIKDFVMLQGLRAKFKQNPDLLAALLATEKRYLEETNTWGDRYWGVCGGKGKNMLGILLMQVRAEMS